MIELLGAEIPVTFLCSYFGVSTSGFYKWLQYLNSTKLTTKRQICEKMVNIFSLSKQTYGSPRIHQELIYQGYKISENTVAKYMRELGLDARLKKRFRVMTTNSNHDGPIADRVFKIEEPLPDKPYQILAGDITF